MKKLTSLLLALILLTVFVSGASIAKKIAECGDDVSCKFRVASEAQNPKACDSFEGAVYENCMKYFGLEPKPVSGSAYLEPEETPLEKPVSTIIGMFVVVSAFIFIVIFLFIQDYKFKYVKRHNEELTDYIERSLDKKKPDDEIRTDLKKVGWNNSVINKVLDDVKKNRK